MQVRLCLRLLTREFQVLDVSSAEAFLKFMHCLAGWYL